MKREEVYKLIDGEREYQDVRWSPENSTCAGKHSITEFLVFIRDYINEALHILSRSAELEATEEVLHIVRKIGGLSVACMEQNGGRYRSQEDIDKYK